MKGKNLAAAKEAAAKRTAKRPRRDGARQPKLALTHDMPKGQTTKGHPLIWLLANKMPRDATKSDLARSLGVAPQSLYKWERLCRADRNFPLPTLRAAQIAAFFKVKPAMFRPDAFGAK